MARKQGDRESGKLGNKIYYTWHGRQCERAMPTHVANPRTEAQQAHRYSFAVVSRLSSYMKEAHLVGLHWHSVREKNSTYALFRRLNKDCFTPDGDVDYPRLVVSKGTLAPAAVVAASVEEGVLTVWFDSAGGKPADEFFLFVYSAAFGDGYLAGPVPRGAGVVSVLLPDEWLDAAHGRRPDGAGAVAQPGAEVVHLYSFVRGYRLRTSDSVHCAVDILQAAPTAAAAAAGRGAGSASQEAQHG